MSSITFDNIGKVYPGGTRAIYDVNIRVEDGNVVLNPLYQNPPSTRPVAADYSTVRLTGRIDAGCERCGKCVAVCPTDALRIGFKGKA